jgi:hypothetical protein
LPLFGPLIKIAESFHIKAKKNHQKTKNKKTKSISGHTDTLPDRLVHFFVGEGIDVEVPIRIQACVSSQRVVDRGAEFGNELNKASD